ncbi:Mobile element protein [Candidatus Enterovibrio altilux]|uniref:Mobile element protein n=1 Tax=Candidatus Enterovibrio altilux TaxID=1927128 RepID=A0A291B8R9_9GAMM|nr:Mobile element protein [Candidatus Enterovibrio luxaltus]
MSDLDIATALIVKCVFSMPLRGLQRTHNFVVKLTQLLLSCPHYSCINKQAKTINVMFKTKNKEAIQYLVIHST